MFKHYEYPAISWDIITSLFSRKHAGPSDFNRNWSELNYGFRRQDTFDWSESFALKETHLFVEQLWFPQVYNWQAAALRPMPDGPSGAKAGDFNY
jgi:hypothetical protein